MNRLRAALLRRPARGTAEQLQDVSGSTALTTVSTSSLAVDVHERSVDGCIEAISRLLYTLNANGNVILLSKYYIYHLDINGIIGPIEIRD